MKFAIGTSDSKTVKVDAMVLADTRALINASSGLGKSWLLRLVAENVAASLQTIIIDPEGEFPTLREKLDLLIVSENGDLRADIRSARLLARRLAETGVSAVIDIYDLPGKEDPWVKRRVFVAEFLGELMNLPKKLYHPMLVMVDEAHQFAMEKPISDTYILNGSRVNPSLISRSAVRSMMSAGRKRGIGGILATQRISKIDKDSIADVRNWFIGGATLDIDQQRAGDILGMSKSESVTLRDLEPGTFYSFGPAVEGKGIVQFTSGPVKTTHPKAGQRSSIVVPKASTQISGIVEQFGDLPAIAEQEVRTLDALQKEAADLRRQLRERPTQTKVEPQIERVEVPIISEREVEALQNAADQLKLIGVDLSEGLASFNSTVKDLAAVLQKANGYKPEKKIRMNVDSARGSQPSRLPETKMTWKASINNGAPITLFEGITGPMQRILDAIAWLESIGIDVPKQVAVAFLANYSYGGGAFNNPRGSLRSAGLVEYVGSESIRLTEEGRRVANYPQAPLTAGELQKHVMDVLPGPHQKILRVLLEKYPNPISKDECAALAGYAPGGAFNNPLGRLRSMGLINYPQPGYVVAESLLFLE